MLDAKSVVIGDCANSAVLSDAAIARRVRETCMGQRTKVVRETWERPTAAAWKSDAVRTNVHNQTTPSG